MITTAQDTCLLTLYFSLTWTVKVDHYGHTEKKYVIAYNLKEIKVLGVSLFSMVSLVVVVPVNNYHQMRVARLRATWDNNTKPKVYPFWTKEIKKSWCSSSCKMFTLWLLISPQHQVVFVLTLLTCDGTQGKAQRNQQLLPLFTVICFLTCE